MKWILVVDDEPHATRLLKLRLENEGYGVDVAPNGEAALAKLEARPYDVLVTDVCMPRMGGRELCELVRKQHENETIHIFVLTSRPEDEHRDWVTEYRRTQFLEKPVSLKRLVLAIAECLTDGDAP